MQKSLRTKTVGAAFLFFLATAWTSATHALALTTTFAGGNGQSGNMFDVVTLGEELTVTAFDLHVGSTTSETVEIYSKAGTHVGFETDSSAWTLLDTITFTGGGVGNASFVDVIDFALPALTTTALYITLTTGTDIDYTNGTTRGNVFAANSDLQILEGVGKSYPFAGTFNPRVWNGTIYYEKGSVPVPATVALLLLGIAGIGLVRAKATAAA